MKGILFKPDMIKAIAEGRKTQTRRVLKLQPKYHLTVNFMRHRYQVGEVVYIKEALRRKRNDPKMPCDYITYVLDDTGVFPLNHKEKYPQFGRPSWIWNRDTISPMFMPAWAARYFIKITDVRAERLNNITEADAELEGFKSCEYDNPDAYADCPCTNQFIRLWDSINKPPNDWQSNPWVWRYEFKMVDSSPAK